MAQAAETTQPLLRRRKMSRKQSTDRKRNYYQEIAFGSFRAILLLMTKLGEHFIIQIYHMRHYLLFVACNIGSTDDGNSAIVGNT
jgi:hypothetical protein